MKKYLFGIYSLVLVLCAVSVPSNVLANDIREPLVIVRFTKQSVNYESKLFSIARKALEIKDTVIFDVIGKIPANRSVSSRNIAVADSLASFGINPAQIKLGTVKDKNLDWEEVHVYVK